MGKRLKAAQSPSFECGECGSQKEGFILIKLVMLLTCIQADNGNQVTKGTGH